ncbi:MAG: ABC transporter permease [Alphaproteobacteria bacterium]|nr:ABC transporter permease [Alphaproteobacteria bacterium]
MKRGRALLLLPSGIVIGAVLVLPLVMLLVISLMQRNPNGGIVWGSFTVDAYVSFLWERGFSGERELNWDYVAIFARSFALAGSATVTSFAIALPTALWMAFQPPKRRLLLVFLVTLPFWTNLLVRNYAWMLLLRVDGVFEQILHTTGLLTGRLGILYTPTATAIGLTYSFLPFMLLPIYLSIEKIDRRLIEAAFDLGAVRFRVLTRVILPLSMPGIAGGVVLVFIPGIGAFISPELLGGGKSMMVGNLIQAQFGYSRNWPFGAALAFVLLALVLAATYLHRVRFRSAP